MAFEFYLNEDILKREGEGEEGEGEGEGGLTRDHGQSRAEYQGTSHIEDGDLVKKLRCIKKNCSPKLPSLVLKPQDKIIKVTLKTVSIVKVLRQLQKQCEK